MLKLNAGERSQLWQRLTGLIEEYACGIESSAVTPQLEPSAIRAALPANFDFSADPIAALEFAAAALSRWQVHTPHPSYFGLFNPAPATMGIAADTLVASFNPQLAAWSHSPFAAEAEALLIRAFGEKFGYTNDVCDGTFCSGGMEANHTAILTALTHCFPVYSDSGLRALSRDPVFYASSESHHSFRKAARMCGLGDRSLRLIEVDASLRMRADRLREAIEDDLSVGHAPFLVAATAGTTNAGAIDPLPECAQIAHSHGLWLHTDAAWGGGAALVPSLRPLLDGIELSDSITFDAHKWLSVPMGAGMFFTRHSEILNRTFRVATAYMPKEAAALDVVDPHLHSMQWSRRFIGLKVLLSLMVEGWEGYSQTIEHQTRMGRLLRERLIGSGWEVVNDTPLPVVCFADGNDAACQNGIVKGVLKSGKAWISTTVIAGRTVIRACITNYDTQPEHVEGLVDLLNRTRSA